MKANINESQNIEDSIKENDKGSAAKGIFWGTLISLLGPLLSYNILLFLYFVLQELQGITSENDFNPNPTIFTSFGIINVLSIILICFFAGYICSRISVSNVYRNATKISIISATLGFLILILRLSFLESTFVIIVSVASIFLGTRYYSNKS